MHLRRIGTLAVLTLVAVACHGNTTGMPSNWGPLALGRDDRCPAVAGRYFDSSAPIAWMLAGRHIPWDSANVDWDYFELAGSADTALTVTVADRDGVQRTGRLTKGTPYAGDYYCADGWLQLGDRAIPATWDDDVKTSQFFPRRHAMRIAPGADNALVARLDFIDFGEFTVWCGDGCKGIPLPWTFETRSSWSAARAWNSETPPQRGGNSEQRPRESRTAERDPLNREEQSLGNGPDIPGQADTRKRALAALVPGMLLRAVSPRDSGWHVSLEFEDLSQLERFMTRLSQSGAVAEIRVIPLYRAKSTNGHWIDVVYVRYAR